MSEIKVQEQVVEAKTPITPSTIVPQSNTISPEDQWLTDIDRQKLASVKAFRDKIYAMGRMSEYENFGKSKAEKDAFWDEFNKLNPKDARAVMAGNNQPKIGLEGIDLEKINEEEVRKILFTLWVERKKKGEI